MNKFDITKKIEEFAPLDLQEKWDCSGWIVCTNKKEINRIMLALTITDDIYNQAKINNCDMIISHHPLFCVPTKYSDIDIYCAHTNMDKTNGGTTDTLIKKLGLSVSKIENEFVRIVELPQSITIDELYKKLKSISPNLRYTNNQNVKNIKTIGFCAGSGSEFVNETICDVFVTGDLKFHTALESNKPVFDIGHFESEILVLEVFKNIINSDVLFAKENSPFLHS